LYKLILLILSLGLEVVICSVGIERSGSHLISPMMQFERISSLKSQQRDVDCWKVKPRHPSVDLQRSRHSSFDSVNSKWSVVPWYSPWIKQGGSFGMQSEVPLRQSLQILESRTEQLTVESWQILDFVENVNHWQPGFDLQSSRQANSFSANSSFNCWLSRHLPDWEQSSYEDEKASPVYAEKKFNTNDFKNSALFWCVNNLILRSFRLKYVCSKIIEKSIF
jgi:hypothetical protein